MTLPAAATMHGVASDARDRPAAAEAVQLRELPATLHPHRNLLRYYLLSALVFGPGFFFAALPFYFRFRTLRYDVDDEGITMRWGILFRREISLTYSRIQDIQLSSNVVERWLGLARIQLQTASGNASAEMTIEGLQDVEAMRDFLYSRMRGARSATRHPAPGAAVVQAAGSETVLEASHAGEGAVAQLAAALDATAAELRALRLELAATRGVGASHEQP